MSTINDPWSVLEITPGADASTVRKAYAKKLKVVQPDENPTEFQALVEARDRALLLIEIRSHQWTPPEAIPPNQRTDPIAEIEPPVVADSVLPMTPQRRLDDAAASEHIEAICSDDKPEKIDFDALKAQLKKLHNMSSVYVDLDGWNGFLAQIVNLPTHMREELEPGIIDSFCNLTQYCERISSFPYVPRDPKDRELILAYDEEFGWSTNDRKVYEVIGRERGDQFKWRLSQIWAEQRPQHDLGRRGLARRAEQATAIRSAPPPAPRPAPPRPINLQPFIPLIAILAMYLIRKFG